METQASNSNQKENSSGDGNKEEKETENEEQEHGQDIADGTENGKSVEDVKVITENGKSRLDIKVVAEEDQLAENENQVPGQDVAKKTKNVQSEQDVKDVTEDGKSGHDMRGVAEEDQSANQQVEQLQPMLAEENSPVPTQSHILPSISNSKDDNPQEINVDDGKNIQLECNPSQEPLPSVSSVLDKGSTYSEKKSIVEHDDRSVKPYRELSTGLDSCQPVIDVVINDVEMVSANDIDVPAEQGKEAVIPDEKPSMGNKEEKVEYDTETPKDHYEGLAVPGIKTSIELDKEPVKFDTEMLTEKDKGTFNPDTDSSIQQRSGLIIPDPETSTGQRVIKLDSETATELGNVPPYHDSKTSADLDSGTSVPPTKMSTEANQETPRLDNETVTSTTAEVPGSKVQSDSSVYKDVSVIAGPAADDDKTYSSGAPQRKTGDVKGASMNHEDSESGTPHATSSNLKHEEGGDFSNQFQSPDSNPLTSDGVSNSMDCFLLAEMSEGTESGTEEEQSAFMKELERFFKERSMEFKPPKFYGQEVNCLKLWRAVIRLGGYEKVTSCKLWREVGESFTPPKTCTAVSWTFRSFYEKALLDYERHKASRGELNVPIASHSEPLKINNKGSGSGRARRDSAARAVQVWHSQRVDNGQLGDPVPKDKNSIPSQKREKRLGRAALRKRKTSPYTEHPVETARAKRSKTQVDVKVDDVGTPANWVKVNVQRTKDCFEVYALVPGLLREEVKVQWDPVGQLVISGEPQNPDNPWGIFPFKKVVNLPSTIDPQQTSAVVTLNGQLFIRVPFK